MKTKQIYGRLNWIPSTNPEASKRPVLVGIPGGPGLSSATLTGIEVLTADFDLALVDPPGTAGTSELAELNLSSMVLALETLLETIERPIGLIGHSFGGAYVGELVNRERLPVVGAAFVASPLGQRSADGLARNYSKHSNHSLKISEKNFENTPSPHTFSSWLKDCSLEFFQPANLALANLIFADMKSARTYGAIRGMLPSTNLLGNLYKSEIPLLMVAGETDRLLDPEFLHTDAQSAGADFTIVEKGSHFLFQSHPKPTADILNQFFQSRSSQ